MNKVQKIALVLVCSLAIISCDSKEEQKQNERDSQAMESKRRAKAASDYYFGKTKERPQYSEDK